MIFQTRQEDSNGEQQPDFLEFLEWFDENCRKLVHRLPEKGSADIK